ncbi:hypothetical protein GALMADRAFT_242016 [Galerina marginata CBS 339.88]|uniref:Uncharacterized protein n=1 Tax=Galerina marginata (strain CBS 339.88) TaxID=685588 RepID=A0A067T9U7_GALM3|nr:hypothetical protein GALMADRAFT_242016 [Galerina marginata CBS 339.88]
MTLLTGESLEIVELQQSFRLPLRLEISECSKGIAFAVTKTTTNESVTCKKEFQIGSAWTTNDSVVDNIFSTYARTRAIPVSAERACLDQFQRSCVAEITELEGKLKETEANVLELCYEAARLCSAITQRRTQVKAVQSLYAPIRSLPPEVLSLIFGMCFEENEYRMNSRTAPLLLCQVCKVWRDVAISIPWYWECSRFDIGSLHDNSISNYQNFLNTITERTGTIAQAIEVRDKRGQHYNNSMTCSKLIKMFTLQFKNCYRLDFVVQTAGWYQCLIKNPITKSMQKYLDTVSLCFKYLIPSNPSYHFTLFKNAHKLTTVILDLRHPFNLTRIILPYHQLSYFDCRFILQHGFPTAFDEWMRFLRKCSNLRSVKVAFLAGLSPGSVSINKRHRTVDLPSVSELSMTMGVDGDLDFVISALSFPNLDKLNFEAIHPCEVVLEENDPSTCRLHISLQHLHWDLSYITDLTLLRVFMAEEIFLPMFQSAPYVERLTISNLVRSGSSPSLWIDDDTRLVQLLTEIAIDTPGGEEEALLPRLRHLKLFYPRHRTDHQELAATYGHLVRARSQLNFVSVHSRLQNGPQFVFRLSFSKEHSTESLTSSILSAIYQMKPAHCHTDVFADICDTFDWKSPKPDSDEYDIMYR